MAFVRWGVVLLVSTGVLTALSVYLGKWWTPGAPAAPPIQLPGLPADAPLPEEAPALLAIIHDGANHADLRCRAATVLLQRDSDEWRQAMLRPIRFSSDATGARLALILAATPPGAQTLLEAFERRTIPPRPLLDPQVRRRLAESSLPDARQRVEALLPLLKPPAAVTTSAIHVHRQALDPLRARLTTGRAVFLGNCSICHRIGGDGASVGPALDSIGFRGPDRLAEDIIDPSRWVDPAYRASRVETKEGNLLTGLIKVRTDKSITLVNSAGHEETVNAEEVESVKPSELSPMPAGFDQALSLEEFNHLLVFLLTCRTEPPAR